MNTHFWVTAYDPDELNAAGPYVNQSKEPIRWPLVAEQQALINAIADRNTP